tara:strand:- start:2517 stop:2951 length:435 start_codon:yes stop_codon:yes gene_type:complete
MLIKVKIKKGYWPEERRCKVLDAAKWALEYYNLHLELIPVTELKIIFTRFDSAYGDAYHDGHYYIVRLSDQYNDKLTIKTVFHEVTHIKQYFYDGLDLGTPAKFKGKKYKKTTYENAPWEVEARKAEKKMWGFWKKYIDISAKC